MIRIGREDWWSNAAHDYMRLTLDTQGYFLSYSLIADLTHTVGFNEPGHPEIVIPSGNHNDTLEKLADWLVENPAQELVPGQTLGTEHPGFPAGTRVTSWREEDAYYPLTAPGGSEELDAVYLHIDGCPCVTCTDGK